MEPDGYIYFEWEPRVRETITLPDNLPREVHRLVWWLQDMCCQRSPFLGTPNCFDIPDFPRASMCNRCRALYPYRNEIKV